jgi:hypothetical protein
MFGANETELLTAQIECQLIIGTKNAIETRIMISHAMMCLAMIWRTIFYALIVSKIGGSLDRDVVLKKINDVIEEVPVQLVSLVFGHFAHAARSAIKFIQAFREIDDGLIEIADQIASAQKYIETNMSALSFWDKEFEEMIGQATAALRRLHLQDTTDVSSGDAHEGESK